MTTATAEHLEAAKGVLLYLKHTGNRGLTFKACCPEDFKLKAFVDADWCGHSSTSRSTTGYVCLLGGAAVSWKSRLQSSTALSTMEAEYMALTACLQDVVYLRELLGELGQHQSEPTWIGEDNEACRSLVENPSISDRSKHIRLRYHYNRERVRDGTCYIQHVSTREQRGDLFTKALDLSKHTYLSSQIMGFSVSGGDGDNPPKP